MKLSTCAALVALGIAALGSPSAQAYTYKKLYDFCSKIDCVDGAAPQAGVIVDSAGNLYGTTFSGGSGNNPSLGGGTVFELSYDAGTGKRKYRRLHSFCRESNCPDGSPRASLIEDVHGNLYGTSYLFNQGCGMIFELTSGIASKKLDFVPLYSFPNASQCPDGGYPAAALSYAGKSSGLPYDGTSPLYGTAEVGGLYSGLVFSLTPSGSSWTFADLHDFSCNGEDCGDGSQPESEVTVDPSGNLFGATLLGGHRDSGVVYELSPGSQTWSENLLHSFCRKGYCKDGRFPDSPLVAGASGAYFGTAIYGGSTHRGCCGVIYKLAPGSSGWTQSVAYDFCSLRNCIDGMGPQGQLATDAAGNIYGTTAMGGGYNSASGQSGGMVFRFDGTPVETLYAFCSADTQCTDGQTPNGVVVDAAGNLFGTTQTGGKYGQGTIFELMP